MSGMRVTGPGGYNAICDVCGWKYKAKDLRLRWDGLWVCDADWEIRNPLDFYRTIPDQKALPFVRSDMEDVPDSSLGSAQFDGNSVLRMQVPKVNSEFDHVFPITIEFWVNFSNLGTARILFTNPGYWTVQCLNTGPVRFILASPQGTTSGFQYTSSFTPNAGTWYKYEFTCQSVGSTLALNIYDLTNTNVSTESGTLGVSVIAGPNNIVSIGNDAGGSFPLFGYLDEVRVWNTIRTAAELAKRRFECISGGEKSLILYLNFDAKTRFSFDNRKTGSLYTGTQGFNFNYPHVSWQPQTFVTP